VAVERRDYLGVFTPKGYAYRRLARLITMYLLAYLEPPTRRRGAFLIPRRWAAKRSVLAFLP
jgi:hypothetical protein